MLARSYQCMFTPALAPEYLLGLWCSHADRGADPWHPASHKAVTPLQRVQGRLVGQHPKALSFIYGGSSSTLGKASATKGGEARPTVVLIAWVCIRVRRGS
jgi:hypothetical protein